jgi:hypothetical protein
MRRLSCIKFSSKCGTTAYTYSHCFTKHWGVHALSAGTLFLLFSSSRPLLWVPQSSSSKSAPHYNGPVTFTCCLCINILKNKLYTALATYFRHIWPLLHSVVAITTLNQHNTKAKLNLSLIKATTMDFYFTLSSSCTCIRLINNSTYRRPSL